MKSGVYVDRVSLKSLDCLALEGIHLDLQGVKGTLTRATACRKAKTIDATGGELTLTSKDGSTSVSGGEGYKVTASGLTLHGSRGRATVTILEATVDPQKVCGKVLLARHPEAEVKAENPCYDRQTKVVTFSGGIATKFDQGTLPFGRGTFTTTKGHFESLGFNQVTAYGLDGELDPKGLLKVTAEKVVVTDPRLHSGPVSFRSVEVSPFDPSTVLTSDLWVSVNGARVDFNISAQHAWGKATCQQWLSAFPTELQNSQIEQVKFKGNLHFDIRLKPDVKLSLSNGCVIDGKTPDFLLALNRPFKYTVYHPKSKGTFERESGPGSANWVPLQLVSENMAKSLTTTEDPGFFSHRGIIPQAIENSIRDNLKMGKFFRGGSTLSMQLSKNLWLSRSRNLGRKFQEAILTTALESTLPKDKILELYLNVVEFGPDLYGIGPASAELLNKEASDLSLSESLYLVLRLPAPSNTAPYPKMKGLIKRLLDNMAATGKVTTDLIEVEKSLLDEPDPEALVP